MRSSQAAVSHKPHYSQVTRILLQQQLFKYLAPIPLASTYGCTELLLTSLSGIVPGMIKYTKPQSFNPPTARPALIQDAAQTPPSDHRVQ